MKKKSLTIKKVIEDYSRAYSYKKRFIDAAQEDYEFYLGEQWDAADVQTLKDAGVRALTVNKIRPQIVLLRGIESENRTEFKAFPEGKEDEVVGEIATRLLKNMMKNSMGDYELSNIFEEGTVTGEGWLEPYIDYSEDILFGDMKFKKGDYFQILVDPRCKKYDLSDAEYVCKFCPSLTKEQILQIYPDMEKALENSNGAKIETNSMGNSNLNNFGVHRQVTDYGQNGFSQIDGMPTEPTWDLLEYYYKCYMPKYYIVDLKLGNIVEATKEQADNYETAIENMSPQESKTVRIIKRMVPEIYMAASIAGMDEFAYNGRSWSYPRWKSYPFINFYVINATTRINGNRTDLLKQGLVRQLKDVQREYNKRKTQSLRHLNTSTNSGWLTEEGAWVNSDLVKKFGSSPGVNLEYKRGRMKPERITPTPLSQGHEQLASGNSGEMKEMSGINPDLLAMQDGGTDSGRAIALRQKQGLVMVKPIFDNFSLTKKIMGRFCLSMLGEVYDIDTAMLVLGNEFISEHFSEPVMTQQVDPKTGQPVMIPMIDPMTGQPKMQVNEKLAAQTVNEVLNDPNLYKYNVEVGESASNETIKYTNFMTLMDLAGKGIAIPPDILIDESLISTGSKKKIISAIKQAQAMQAASASPAKKGA